MIPFNPNIEQINCIDDISKFIKNSTAFSKLLINGSAGTGKTTIIISTLVKLLMIQMKENIPIIMDTIETRKWDNLSHLHNFIITAPTNKAKDILVNKYNIFIESLTMNDIYSINGDTNGNTNSNTNGNTNGSTSRTNDNLLNIFITILSKKITFLTVSQLLSISRVINEMGEEEFTKGNEKKIMDKYNKDTYLTTSIIVDECSMIDTHTTKLLNVIKCPIIYIGDYCQLPPVNEFISPTFEIDKLPNTKTIILKQVERCKNDITIIANQLRDKIYKISPSFNLLDINTNNTNNVINIILYNKKFGSWVRTYVKDIKSKQKDLKLICKTIKDNDFEVKTDTSSASSLATGPGQVQVFDTMALGWTNKCCMLLNEKIRGHLFEDVENIASLYLIKGDKLLIKSPYYKYNNHLFSSSIVYVANLKETTYKPLSFKEWCNIVININCDGKSEDDLEEKKPIFNIDINSLFNVNDTMNDNSKDKKKLKNLKNIEDYFNVEKKTDKQIDTDTSSQTSSQTSLSTIQDNQDNQDKEELLVFRSLFYKHHHLANRISTDNYIFTDEISLKYNLLIPGYDLHNISKISSHQVRASLYTKWHTLVSIKLFGIPNETIGCKKCAFFINKFMNQMKTSTYISDFIDATEKLQFDMYLCDLVSFTSNGKIISKNIPILNMNNETNIENIKILRTIIKNSYEVKVLLSRNEERELNSINKMLNEEGGDGDGPTKYVTLSQLFGHYMSHVITSCYPEIDYGYALTIHKSQGSTYDDVYIEYANILSNTRENEKLKLLYTAITRSSNKLHIFY
jgi:hypothetical protein